MAYLTPDNCEDLTDHSYEDILSLAGILGLHSREELNTTAVLDFNADITAKTVSFDLETIYVTDLEVEIYTTEKIIKPKLIVSTRLKKGIALQWLFSIVQTGMRLGYKEISINAYGSKLKPKWTGYYTWGKYGFEMYEDEDLQKFDNKIKSYKSKTAIKNIFELSYAEGGMDFWKENGEGWLGRIVLNPSSSSYRNFLVAYQRMSNKLI